MKGISRVHAEIKNLHISKCWDEDRVRQKKKKNNEFDSRLENLMFIILYKTSRKGSRGPGDEVRRS
jgi:hypothetical protein